MRIWYAPAHTYATSTRRNASRLADVRPGWPSRAIWSGEPGQDAARMRVQDDLDDIRRVIGDPHELRVRRGNLATGEQRPLDPGQQPGPVLPADEDDREPGDFSGLHQGDRKSTRLNSSHVEISYAVFCLKK